MNRTAALRVLNHVVLRGDVQFQLRLTAPLMKCWRTAAAAVNLVELAVD
jgi:hypothetical protein